MNSHSLLKIFLTILTITTGVYLSFRFLLPLFLPFIIAYLLMRMLAPVIRFFKKKCHFPGWLSCTTTLALFFATVTSLLWLILWKICQQLQLLLINLPVYRQMFAQMFSTQSKHLCNCLDYYLSMDDGTAYNFLNTRFLSPENGYLEQLCSQAGGFVVSCFSGSIHFLAALFVIIIGMIVLCKDMPLLQKLCRHNVFYPTLHRVWVTLKETGLTYMKSQCIIILANWAVCSAGLLFIRNPYSILLGCFIAIFDAFPILGSGMILIPWGIYHIVKQNFFQAAVLFSLYLLTMFIREILEARLLGGGMDMLPFFMLAAIYIGLQLFGIAGIVLGPFGVVLIRAIYQVWTDNKPLKYRMVKDSD